MSRRPALEAEAPVPRTLATIGLFAQRLGLRLAALLAGFGGVVQLFGATVTRTLSDPFSAQRGLLSRQLFTVMRSVGVRSLPIVSLVSFLMGAILVLQTGEPLREFGQIQEVPGAVAWSLTREISPLMTAILMTARVGASFTAVLGSMKINEEILALETMGIRVIGFLIVPRWLSMLVMVPCLTVYSYLLGMVGGALVAKGAYGLSLELYAAKTIYYLNMTDLGSGLVKSAIFGTLITMVSCHFGLETEGGPVGLGRSIMIAVVTSLVSVIVADALATGVINNYVL
ncbi:MAG: ABC transporter permease [Thermoanaerobaculia bacterium]|nr:ABC transporter permease [Thermoanaerobaculia bacterium]